MIFLFVLFFFITALSLYEYFSSKDLKNITVIASKAKFKNTVHELQRFQTVILSSILGGFLLLAILTSTVYDNMVFVSHVMQQTNPNEADTIEIIFNLPPPEEEKQQEEIQRLVNKDLDFPAIENALSDQSAEEGVQNFVGDGLDYSPNTSEKYSSVEEEIRAFEKALFEGTGGEAQRAQIQKKREELQRKKEQYEKEQATRNEKQGTGTSTKKGKTMVSYELANRQPHNNDVRNIRNPGYTCEQGSYGEVVIKIKVNGMGNITSAVPLENYTSLNPCLVEQALKYAKLSRFNASDKSSQEGTISYIFMP